MKVLIVTNLYPPHTQGGYELRCQQVAENLLLRGHDVRVVTSSYRISGTTDGTRIEDDRINGVSVARFLRQHRLEKRGRGRWLHNLDVVWRQLVDANRFGEILDAFKPDLVSWWNLEGVTKAILEMPRTRGIPSVHWIEDNWMIREFGTTGAADQPFWFDFWRVRWGPRPMRPIVRMALAPVERRALRRGIPTRVFGMPPAHVCFTSEFWRFLHQQAGLPVHDSRVIYGGVSPQRFFTKRSPSDYKADPLRLLYAGFLDQRRGLHVIIEALGLIGSAQRDRMHLSVAFPGPLVPDDYVTGIMRRIDELGLTQNVTFLGRIPHHEMPAVFASHDVLVFASVRNEGMPMGMMEAMCSGCAVLTTGSGGAFELAEKTHAPLFPKDHPFALGRLLSALERDRAHLAELALDGQHTVLREFRLERLLDEACETFSNVAARGAHGIDVMDPCQSRHMRAAGRGLEDGQPLDAGHDYRPPRTQLLPDVRTAEARIAGNR